jgi:hypothetical protein
MARQVFTNGALQVNSVDLSNHVSSITVNRTVDTPDITAMGASGHEMLPSLRNDSFQVTFRQDFAATSVDATLDPLFASGSTFLVKAWANGTTTSATNPSYSGTVFISEYTPISGGVGDVLDAPVTFLMANGGAIVRGTS